MKIIKNILLSILAFVTFIFVIVFLIKRSSLKNLNMELNEINSEWTKLYDSTNSRLFLLNEINTSCLIKQVDLDTLKAAILKNRKHRNLYKKECNLDFNKLEFDVNKLYLKLQKKLRSVLVDSLCVIDRENIKILDKVKTKDQTCNAIEHSYNMMVEDYNIKVSTFPQSLFAKKNGLVPKKYFNMNYGIENEDPIEKNKKINEWILKGDSL